jgi:2-keto-4-pentenoate hydratase
MGITLKDDRILRGMERQLDIRQLRIIAGDKPLGWKVGFGSKKAMAQLGIEAPLVGFITDRVMLPSQSTVSVEGWMNPAAEPEIALYLGQDLLAGASRPETREAIAAVAPAIELVDVNLIAAADTVEDILAGNVFNRHVIVGQADESRAGCNLDGLVGHVYRDDEEIATESDLEGLTGDLLDIVRHVADVLGAFEKRLRAGEFLIMGSIVSPLWVSETEAIRYRLDPIDTLQVKLTI